MPSAVFGAVATTVLVFLVVVVIALLVGDSETLGDAGRLSEELYERPSSVPPVQLTDATAEWGLARWAHTATEQLSGGVAIGDIDGDGHADLVVGGGDLGVFLSTGTGGGFRQIGGVVTEDLVTAVGLGDVDGDGAVDLLVATAGDSDLVVWGGAWAAAEDLSVADVTALSGGQPSTGLIPADLNGDGVIDILRLGYGGSEPSEDVVFSQSASRQFTPVPLPNSARRSLAAEVVDIDGDGGLDIWVTRDVGWRVGGDSVYSRGNGRWEDIATELGVAIEIDGMGVTVADLTGDGVLDAYVSDVGDNELLAGGTNGFSPELAAGMARIRPPGAGPGLVSSSWASGAADLNLDGKLDLVVVNGGFDGRSIPNKIPDTKVLLTDPPAIFLGIGDGTFADVWPELEIQWNGSSRGMALGDLDGDGDTDIVVVNHGGGLVALRNDTEGDSLKIHADEPTCGAGAVVTVMEQQPAVISLLEPHSFLGAHAPEVIVGVRPDSAVRIRVDFRGERLEAVDLLNPDAARSTLTLSCADLRG